MLTANVALAKTEDAKIRELLALIEKAADSGQYQVSLDGKKRITERQAEILRSLGFNVLKAPNEGYLDGAEWRTPYATND